MNLTATQAALFLVSVALATGAQCLTGFAFALILLGLGGLFNVAPLADLVNVAMVLGLANALVALRGSGGPDGSGSSLDKPALRDLSIGGFAGIVVGVLLLGWLSANVVVLLRVLLGLTVIACAIVVLLDAAASPIRSRRSAFLGWGAFSGLLGGLFSTGGPPLVYHLYRQPMVLKAVRDTLVATLALSSLMRLAIVLPTGQFSLHAAMLCALAAPLVFGLTWWLERHPPGWSRKAVLRLVCALLLLTGVALLGLHPANR